MPEKLISSTRLTQSFSFPTHSETSSSVPEMKAPRACRQCRESKRKCVRPQPGSTCSSCQQKLLRCGGGLPSLPRGPFDVSSNGDQSGPSVVADDSHETPPGLTWKTTLELVELYLEKVHDRPHSIFHPATLRSQLQSNTLTMTLLCALCAIGSKYSEKPDQRSLGAPLVAEAKRLLQADLENICMENIQACILVATLCAGGGRTSSEALFVRKMMPLSLPPPRCNLH